MGISRENIAVFGWKKEHAFFDDDSSNSYAKYYIPSKNYRKSEKFNYKEENVPICIVDGMDGEYSIFGLLLGYYGDGRLGEERSLDLEITLKDIESLRIRLYNYCNEIKLQDCYEFGEPSLIIFSHYS